MLLNKIILALKKGKILTYEDLAIQRDVDRGIVDDAIQHLSRMGYLTQYCPERSSCANCDSCRASRAKVNLWLLTAQGNRYLKEISKY